MLAEQPQDTEVNTVAFDSDEAAVLLALLSHAGRYHVMVLILEREWSVGALCRQTGLTESALSHHLRMLRDAGLAVARRQAQTVFYSSKSVGAAKLIALMRSLCA